MNHYIRKMSDKPSNGWSNKKSKQKLIEQNGTVCNNCNQAFPPKFIEIDHIEATGLGGKQFDIKNHQLLCIKCHRKKTYLDKKLIQALKNLGVISKSGRTEFSLEEIRLYVKIIREIFVKKEERT